MIRGARRGQIAEWSGGAEIERESDTGESSVCLSSYLMDQPRFLPLDHKNRCRPAPPSTSYRIPLRSIQSASSSSQIQQIQAIHPTVTQQEDITYTPVLFCSTFFTARSQEVAPSHPATLCCIYPPPHPRPAHLSQPSYPQSASGSQSAPSRRASYRTNLFPYWLAHQDGLQALLGNVWAA